MDKKQLTESDIRARFITPAIEQAGWDPMTQVFHEFGLRAGRISVRGKTAHRDASTILKADYALFFKPTRANELRALCADLRQRLSDQKTTQTHLADALMSA